MDERQDEERKVEEEPQGPNAATQEPSGDPPPPPKEKELAAGTRATVITVLVILIVVAAAGTAFFIRGYLRGESQMTEEEYARHLAREKEQAAEGMARLVERVGAAVVASAPEVGSLRLADGRTVRLIGVRPLAEGAPAYDEAKGFFRSLIVGKTVRLKFDKQRKDEKKRLLAYVYLPAGKGEEERMVNRILLRSGRAELGLLGANTLFKGQFESDREHARQRKRGFWAEK